MAKQRRGRQEAFTPRQTPGGPKKRVNASRTPLLNLSKNGAHHHTPRASAPTTPMSCTRTALYDQQPNNVHQSATKEALGVSKRLYFAGDSNPPPSSPSYASVAARSPPSNTDQLSSQQRNHSVRFGFESIHKSESVQQLYALMRKDPVLQKQWWPLKMIIHKINRLNCLCRESQLLPAAVFGRQYSLSEIVHDLQTGCSPIVASADLQGSFSGYSGKEIFLRTSIINGENVHAILVDLSNDASDDDCNPKVQTPHEWLQSLHKKRHSLIRLVPSKYYHMINPWYDRSTEMLFGARDGETAREAVEALLAIMTTAVQSPEGAKSVTEGLQKGEKVFFVDGVCAGDDQLELKFNQTNVEKLAARNRDMAIYMRKALQLVLRVDAENSQLNWGKCCQEAVNMVQETTGFDRLNTKTGGRAVEVWFRTFRVKRLFWNPLLLEQHGIAFFLNHPESANRLREFGNNNLENLNIEKMREFLLETELPKLVAECNATTKQKGVTVKSLLQNSGISVLCLNTIHRWMLFLGFRRDKYRKSFYTDNHERPDVVLHRIEYCLEYFQLELRAAVWIQLTAEKAAALKDEGKIMKENDGYPYEDGTGTAMVEFHVDDVKDSWLLTNGSPFGGFLSVRKSPHDKQIIMWGQDEVVCHEKQQNAMVWYGSDGRSALRPKDKGSAMHISGIVSREAGWDCKPRSTEELAMINQLREGKNYVAEDAAIDVTDKANKELFTEKSVSEFGFRWAMVPGANNEGYWNSNYALIQLENCMDVANVMFPDCEHIIYFDHSQGHKAKRKDGLEASTAKLNKGFGGKQAMMRNTVLDASCLGTFIDDKTLTVGATQCCVFSEQDDGPCWLSPDERLAQKYDRVIEGQTMNRALRTK